VAAGGRGRGERERERARERERSRRSRRRKKLVSLFSFPPPRSCFLFFSFLFFSFLFFLLLKSRVVSTSRVRPTLCQRLNRSRTSRQRRCAVGSQGRGRRGGGWESRARVAAGRRKKRVYKDARLALAVARLFIYRGQ
jgi:hypothetical protein